MDFLIEHYIEIFAIFGAVYSLARLIVNLTPTPSDNIALDKVGILLKTLAKIFGLDLTVGIDSKPSEKGNASVILLLLIVLIAPLGCATYKAIHEDQRAECVSAYNTYTAVVVSLTELRIAGVFSQKDVASISVLIHKGKEILDNWNENVLSDSPVLPEDKSEFNDILNKLILFNYSGE